MTHPNYQHGFYSTCPLEHLRWLRIRAVVEQEARERWAAAVVARERDAGERGQERAARHEARAADTTRPRGDTPHQTHPGETPCTDDDPTNAETGAAANAAGGVTTPPAPNHPPCRKRRPAPPAPHGPTPEQVGQAAALCFRDEASDAQIAQRVGIARRTLARWKHRADFAAALAALAAWTRQGDA
jgi:hypothetical protein